MKNRIVKPGFFLNEILSTCTPHTRLLFIGLLMLADREGRIEYRPVRIRAQIFPYEQVDVTAMLDELLQNDFIEVYEGDGIAVIEVKTFTRHQSIHPKEAASQLPDKQRGLDGLPVITGKSRELNTGNEFAVGKGKGKGKGTEGMQGKPKPVVPETKFYMTAKKKKMTGSQLADFENLWSAFNYKKGKADAADAFLNIPGYSGQLFDDEILPAAKAEADIRPEQIAKDRTPKMLQGWLTDRRWEDEVSKPSAAEEPEDDGMDRDDPELDKMQAWIAEQKAGGQ